MAIDAFETMTLVGVLDRQPTERLFFLDEFFTSEITFTTETIAFDEVGERYRKLAPFVAPNVQGRVMKSQGFTTKTFRPAYVKPKHIVDPNKQFARRAGEALATGSLTPGQRFDAAVAENLRIEQDMIRRRENWMAAQAVIHGTVLVAGEDYPPVTVDFGRDAGLTSVLAGTARWGEADADPERRSSQVRRCDQSHHHGRGGVRPLLRQRGREGTAEHELSDRRIAGRLQRARHDQRRQWL
jgi:hypothetical protein